MMVHLERPHFVLPVTELADVTPPARTGGTNSSLYADTKAEGENRRCKNKPAVKIVLYFFIHMGVDV